MKHSIPLVYAIALVVSLCISASARAQSAEADAPAVAPPSPPLLRIALVADPHVTLAQDADKAEWIANFERTIAAVNAAAVDVVLLAGDLTQNNKPEDVAKYLEMVKGFKAPIHHVAGNHDVGDKVLSDKKSGLTAERVALFEKTVAPAFFVGQLAPTVRVVGITSSLMGSGLPRESEQWSFLETALTADESQTTLLLTHYPLFVNTLDEPSEYFNIEPESRMRLLRMMQAANVRVVLSGHTHRPLEHKLGAMHMITAPPVSFGLPKGQQPEGWTLVTLSQNGDATAELRYLDAPTPTVATAAPAPARPTAASPAPAHPRASSLDLKQFGPMAVLPLATPDNHVFDYLRSRGAEGQLTRLTPAQLVEPGFLTPERFKVCLYLSGEQYQRTVLKPNDADKAIQDYMKAGGILVVLSTGPFPFYMDEKGVAVTTASRFGLVLLGNGEEEGTAIGFDEPPAGAPLSFETADAHLRTAAGLPERLPFPTGDERRWRPLVRLGTSGEYEPWVRLVDEKGKWFGDAAALVGKATSAGAPPARVVFVSHLLTQHHEARDQVLDAVMLAVQSKLAPASATSAASAPGGVSDRVHAFYYNWYGAPPHQRDYIHWQQGGHTPPDSIGANFYPQLGAYSSADPAVLRQHMAWLRQARVGVACVTWWGRDSYEERLTLPVLDAAAEAGLRVNFHLEPYAGQTPASTMADVRYIIDRYGKHPAFYRAADLGNRPMFYIFNSLQHDAAAWKQAIATVRGTPYDAVLLAQTSDLRIVQAGDFDGGYPYDGLAPFKNEAFHRTWVDQLAPDFRAAGKVFVPSVGPGYWDDRAVPTGADEPAAAETRDGGEATTYARGWQAAIDAAASYVSITSFNEWHEGSQIEPAVERSSGGYTYPGYRAGPMEYLDRTAEAVARFEQARTARQTAGAREGR